jgi:ABC-type amino acid transport substrate-binding protein
MNLKIKKGLILAIIGCATILSTSQANARNLEDIITSKELNVGVIPFDVDIIKDPISGKYKGVFIDSIEYVCERMRVTCKYQEYTWQTFVAALQARQIDISIATTYATISRATAVSFTRPIYFLGYKAVTKKSEERFKSAEDLNHESVKVAVCQGCGQMEWVQKVAPKAQLRVVPSEEGAMLEVLTGQADIAIGAAAPANNALRNQSSLKVALGGRIYSKNQVAWAVNKADTELKVFFDTALGQLVASGKLRELAEAYQAQWLDSISE